MTTAALAVYAVLPNSPAMTYGELTDRFGWSRRKVEAAVQELRLAGYSILTDERGAWVSHDPAEIRACYRALRSRYISQAVTARALLRSAQRLERSPLTLWSAA